MRIGSRPSWRASSEPRAATAPLSGVTTMAMDARDIEGLIKAALPDAQITIRDLAGDGDHYAAEVVSELFRRQEPRPAAPDGLCRARRATWAARSMPSR